MACSQWGERKCPTWSIALSFLTLFVGFMRVEITYAHNQDIGYAEEQEIFMSNNDTTSGLVIGIDFGTSYFRAGILKDGKVEIIVDDQGYRVTPSCVAFVDGEQLVGEAAKNQAASNPLHTVFDVKRIIGRRFDDSSVQNDIKYFPFQVINKDGQPYISVPVKGEEDALFTSEEILAMLLGTIKDKAEKYLGEPVKDAIITVPTYFTDTQRAATKDAGTIAGLNILRVINETTAAAIAYGLDKLDETEHHTLVYDLGSTFDVAIIVVEDGVFDHLTTAGDPHLGGEDFNNRVISYFIEKYNKENNFDIAKDARSMEKLKREVEKAKHNLSFLNSTNIEIESFHRGSHFSETLTRAQFEALNNDLFEKTLQSVKKVLRDAKMKKSDIDDFVIIGGSAHIPKVQQMLEEYFGKKPLKEVNPEEAAVMGAAILGAVIYGDGGSDDNLIGHECGCAWGISPLSLGIETADGTMSRLISRGTIIPTKKSQIFPTTADNQSMFVVKVFQGERFMAKDNHKLAEFELTDIPLAPRGVSQIEVTFELDINRNLKVSAIDIDSGKFESISITSHNQISNEDVDNMVEEAEKYAEEDLANRERIESRNKLRNYICNLERQTKDNKGINEKQPLLDALKKTQDWLNENAAEARVEDFEDQLQKLSDANSLTASKASYSSW